MIDSPMSTSESDYQKQEKAIKTKLNSAAKGSDSEILKDVAKEVDRENDDDINQNCRMVNKLVNEGLDMYREGDMEFADMIDDLCKALKAI